MQESTYTTPLKRPLILIFWPAISIVLVLFAYAAVNFVVGGMAPDPTSCDGSASVATSLFNEGDSKCLFGETPIWANIVNIILFIVGSASVAFGPASFVAGIVLLVTRTELSKSKLLAICLAIFCPPFTWVYTYERDAKKFWLSLVLTPPTLLLWTVVAWVWGISDAIRRPQEFYKGYFTPQPLMAQE